MVIADYFLNGAVVAVFVIALFKVFQMILESRKLTAKFKNFPQEPANPFFGHLLQYPGTNDAGLAYQRQQTEKFPRLSCVWIAQTPMVFVSHPDTLKIILKSSEPKAHRIYHFLTSWIGDGLLKSNGSKWARNRRLLTPAFHFDILKGYLKLKNKLCDDLLTKFEEACVCGKSLNVFERVSMFTLDVMLQSTMSYETGCQKGDGKHPYILAVNRLISKATKRFFQPWLHSDFVYFMTPTGISFMRDCNRVHQVADQIISKRKMELNISPLSNGNDGEVRTKCRDFLDTLLMARDEDGNGLTDREIRDEVDTFLFEGHDTTSSAISWSLYSIADHPDIQRRIQEEVDGLLDGRDNDYLLWEDLAKLPYLTMVVKEAMRLHTPVPFISRDMTKDTTIEGCTIPAGTMVMVNIYNIHHNPTVWEDSMKFDPERFSPENAEKRDPFAFIPFSAGPRNCIGQNFAMDEIKVALVRILHRYTISLDPTHHVSKFEGMVMKAETDIKLCVKPRLS